MPSRRRRSEMSEKLATTAVAPPSSPVMASALTAIQRRSPSGIARPITTSVCGRPVAAVMAVGFSSRENGVPSSCTGLPVAPVAAHDLRGRHPQDALGARVARHDGPVQGVHRDALVHRGDHGPVVVLARRQARRRRQAAHHHDGGGVGVAHVVDHHRADRRRGRRAVAPHQHDRRLARARRRCAADPRAAARRPTTGGARPARRSPRAGSRASSQRASLASSTRPAASSTSTPSGMASNSARASEPAGRSVRRPRNTRARQSWSCSWLHPYRGSGAMFAARRRTPRPRGPRDRRR